MLLVNGNLSIIIRNIKHFKTHRGKHEMRETSKMKRFGSLFLATTLLAGVLAGCNSDEDNSSSAVVVVIQQVM